MEKSLFSIQVSENGKLWLGKLFSIARVLFLFSILISLFGLFHFYVHVRFIAFSGSVGRLNNLNLVNRLYGLFFHILFPVQVYYYYKFGKEANAAIKERSSDRFNRSFKFLYMNAVVGIVSFLLNLLYVAYISYTDWSLLRLL